MTFEEQLKAETNPWVIRIGQYLQSRNDLKDNLNKENKSLKECFDYILQELSKKAVTEDSVGYVAGDDDELFGLAVHYYDEDDIEVKNHNFKTNANGSLTFKDLDDKKTKKSSKAKEEKKEDVSQEAIDKAVAIALEKYKEEEKAKLLKEKEAKAKKRKEARAKKTAVDENQLSLLDFDFGGNNDV